MKAEELRIGNYYAIAENDGIKYKQVKWLINSSNGFFSGDDNLTYAAKSIPLTEEWLRRFEYDKTNEIEWQGHYHQIEELSQGLFTDKRYGIVIKYVHQLQNLYFALTGEELKIKQ